MPYTTGQIALAHQAAIHLNSGNQVAFQLGAQDIICEGKSALDEESGVLEISRGGEKLAIDIHRLIWIKLLPDGPEYI